MKRVAFFGIVLLAFFLLTCDQATQTNGSFPPGELSQLEKSVLQADNSFGLKLFTRVNKNWKDENVFISPLSVSMALAMTLNGANGATYDSIRKTLELTGFTADEINASHKNIRTVLPEIDPKVLFEIANSIWYRLSFTVEQEFLTVNRDAFGAEVTQADFADPATLDAINAWVNENTHGKITKILDRIDPSALMFLINAIYFKGTWMYAFDAKNTSEIAFRRPDGSSVPCSLMHQEATLAYALVNGVQVVDLPYGDSSYSMTVLLPGEGVDIESFAENLSQETWNQFTAAPVAQTIRLYMPRFRLEWEDILNNSLSDMGMDVAFTPSADFTRINKNGGIYIGFVKHKTFVQVDEEGTEAAAVTIVGFKTVNVGGPPVVMLNRPFLFVIHERTTGTILFLGKVVDPS